MTYRITTPVGTEPVSRAEARLQLRLSDDDTSRDTYIDTLITAAREFAEHYTGRALAAQTLEQALDEFPADVIELDMPPVTAITSVKYTDTAGVEQTVAPGDYALSLYGASRELAPTFGKTWPATRAISNAVRIVTVCGYTTAPKAVKQAILLHVQAEFNGISPAERVDMERARNALLDTVKQYGF